MNSNDKDFIDNFFDYCATYKSSGVRFLAVIIIFAFLFIIGLFYAPGLIRLLAKSFPFRIEFLQFSPIEIIYNYVKIAFFFSSFLSLPIFVYQFGKLKFEHNDIEEKTNHLLHSLILSLHILLGIFITYKLIFPLIISFLYGLNFDVATFSSNLSAMVSSFIYASIVVILLISLPFTRFLIKNSMFFNYSELVQIKKPMMLYLGILTAIISLPIEILSLGIVFLTFLLWYKLLIHFAKTRE